MADKISIKNIIFEVRPNPRRKYIAVGVDYDGSYYIKCPLGFDEKMLKQTLFAQIEEFIAKLEGKGKTSPVHKYLQGELFFFKGERFPLIRCSEKTTPQLELKNGAFYIASDTEGREFELFERWYSRSLYNDIKEILPFWTKKLEVSPLRVYIKTVKTLWGSCSSKSSITFSTRLALVPPALLEYVIVHELCHMKEMNHSSNFWLEVEKHIPDYAYRRSELKKNSSLYVW